MIILPNNLIELTIILPKKVYDGKHAQNVIIKIPIKDVAQLQKTWGYTNDHNDDHYYIHTFYTNHVKNQLALYFPQNIWKNRKPEAAVTLETPENEFNLFPQVLGPNNICPNIIITNTTRKDYNYPHNTQYK